MSSIDDIKQIRQNKADDLRKEGINPYPSRTKRNMTVSQIKSYFSMLKNTLADVTGRIMAIRPHGKITFLDIQDETGQLQLFFSYTDLGEKYDLIERYYDIGDFIEASGGVFITKAGEITLKVENFTMLTKALRAIPSEFYGLKDEEEKIRRRYVELAISQDKRNLFRKRSEFVSSIRRFLQNNNFLEVETPILGPVAGGAEANPFITHHDTLAIDLFLRISLELPLKRLLVAGYEKVFEIGKVFRNEGMSKQHLQEFSELEFYWAYADYQQLMNFIESLFAHALMETFHTFQFPYEDHIIDFSTPWKRVDYDTLFKENGIDLTIYNSKENLRELGLSLDLCDDLNGDKNRWIDRIYKKIIRPNLIQPCFLLNHPTILSPLAKQSPEDPDKVERFQILAAGMELGNGFSELNDPKEQRARFSIQQKLRDSGDSEAQMMDEDFLEALEYGMPPAAGFGTGIDRLFFLLSGSNNIRDVVFFPTLKDED